MRLHFWMALPILLLQNASPPASLEGIVVSFGTNEPIANADVELKRILPASVFAAANLPPDAPPETLRLLVQTGQNLSAAPPPAGASNSLSSIISLSREVVDLTVTTAKDGRFSFKNVPPGEY